MQDDKPFEPNHKPFPVPPYFSDHTEVTNKKANDTDPPFLTLIQKLQEYLLIRFSAADQWDFSQEELIELKKLSDTLKELLAVYYEKILPF